MSRVWKSSSTISSFSLPFSLTSEDEREARGYHDSDKRKMSQDSIFWTGQYDGFFGPYKGRPTYNTVPGSRTHSVAESDDVFYDGPELNYPPIDRFKQKRRTRSSSHTDGFVMQQHHPRLASDSVLSQKYGHYAPRNKPHRSLDVDYGDSRHRQLDAQLSNSNESGYVSLASRVKGRQIPDRIHESPYDKELRPRVNEETNYHDSTKPISGPILPFTPPIALHRDGKFDLNSLKHPLSSHKLFYQPHQQRVPYKVPPHRNETDNENDGIYRDINLASSKDAPPNLSPTKRVTLDVYSDEVRSYSPVESELSDRKRRSTRTRLIILILLIPVMLAIVGVAAYFRYKEDLPEAESDAESTTTEP